MKNYYQILKRLWKIYTPFHKYIYLQLGIIFLTQIISISTSVINSKFLNYLVEKNTRIVIYLFCIWLSLRLLENLLDYFSSINRQTNLGQSIAQYLQEFSLGKILGLTINQHIEDHSAIKQTVIVRGEGAVDRTIDSLFITIIPAVSYLIISLATLTYHSRVLGLVSILIMAVLFFWSYIFTNFHHPFVKKNRDNWVTQYKIRTEAFTHLSLVKYFGRESFFIKRYIDDRIKIVDHHLKTQILSINHRIKKNTFIEFAEMGSLGVATYFFLIGRFEIGTIYLVLNLNSRMYWQIASLQATFRNIPSDFLDVEKYLEVIEKKPSFEESGNINIPNGDIIFSNLGFKYPYGDDDIFANFSVTLPAGKTSAFVGTSGSGKSTIIKLLMRAYDYSSGSITIGGQEIKSLDAKALRHSIGYVEQHVDLFDDTIKENILFGVLETDRDEAEKNLESIAKKSRISEFYHRLGDKKFDTFVGERGVKLSGGERQRVGIARAIIKNPNILIFDEATSALDSENEKYIHDAIEEVSKGKTTIIIAHRLSTVRNADKIIVMDKGTVVAEGTHDELLTNSTHYQTLVAHQLSE